MCIKIFPTSVHKKKTKKLNIFFIPISRRSFPWKANIIEYENSVTSIY